LIERAATNGYLDPVAIEDVSRYEEELYRFLESRHPAVLTTISEKKVLDDAVKASLVAGLKDFAQNVVGSKVAVA